MDREAYFNPTPPQPSSVLFANDGGDSQGQTLNVDGEETMSTVTTFDFESRQSSHQVLRTGLASTAQGAPRAVVTSADVTITTFDLESQPSSMRKSRPAHGTPLPPRHTVAEPAGAALMTETTFDLASQPSSWRVPQRSVPAQSSWVPPGQALMDYGKATSQAFQISEASPPQILGSAGASGPLRTD